MKSSKPTGIIQASFFWQNDKPSGIGFTLGPPTFTPNELNSLLRTGDAVKQYMRDSDAALGSNLVNDYLNQLAAIAATEKSTLSLEQAILAALNITWLSSRGFIPNDEFNGVQYITIQRNQS